MFCQLKRKIRWINEYFSSQVLRGEHLLEMPPRFASPRDAMHMRVPQDAPMTREGGHDGHMDAEQRRGGEQFKCRSDEGGKEK